MVRWGAGPEGWLGQVVCPGLGGKDSRRQMVRAGAGQTLHRKGRPQGRVCGALSAGREKGLSGRSGEAPHGRESCGMGGKVMTQAREIAGE